VTAAGNAQGAGTHPLISSAVEIAGSGAFVWTGRLSALMQPWLADHTVQAGNPVVPGTAFLELALKAAQDTGCGHVAELNLSSPLVLPEHGEARIQVWAGAPDESGDRDLTIHSQSSEDPHAPWTEHASGRLTTEAQVEPFDALPWPPVNAQPLDATGLYARLAETGFGYGPAFQGLRAAWQRGDELFAEVALPEEVDGTGYGLHPALLDACLHTGALAVREADGWNGLPFSWTGVSLHAVGESAVRVRLAPAGDGAVSIALADVGGAPVASIESLVARPVPSGGFQPAAVADAHYRIDWTTTVTPGEPGAVAIIGTDTGLISGAPELRTYPDLASVPADATTVVVPVTTDLLPPASIHAATAAALALIQKWIGSPRPDGARLVFVTRGAQSGGDLASSAVWGLVRSALSEEPGRFALIDLDPADAAIPAAAIPATALTTDEPELLVRGGAVLAPRLVRVRQENGSASESPWGDGTVLITGASGGLAGLVARHLVVERGVRSLLLVSRRGAAAEGTSELLAELAELGAVTNIEACDISDRDSVSSLLDRYGPQLSAVVHTAAVLDDGVISSLTPERLDSVLRPKAIGAWHLHELTADLDLSAFVLFSSMAGTSGSAGQGNYAAANAFLDGLARHRHAAGLPGVSLAWGPWAADAGRLDADTAARMTAAGIPPLSPELGLALFDAAVAGEDPVPVLTRLNPTALRARGIVPAVLRSLIAAAPTAARQKADSSAGLAHRLSTLPEDEAQAALLQLICAQAAAVLGHSAADEVEPDRAFKEVGFDSLKALEFRNRVGSLTGLKLPATLVFNYPTPRELVPVLYQGLAPQRPSPEASVLTELDRIENLLSSLDDADEALLGRVAGRLEVLRSRWDARRGPSHSGGLRDLTGPAADGDGIDFESASDDEVFDLLDRELGQ
jgi:pimaricinolide synthase PimS1